MTDNEWRKKASCRAHSSELWFPERSNQSKTAVEICHACPVRRQCAEDAVKRDERWAIVAGFRCGEKKERDALKDWLNGTVVQAPKPRQTVRSRSSCERIPAGPASEHMKALAEVMRYDELIAITGLTAGVVSGLLYGRRGKPRQTVRKEDAEKVFSVQIEAAS
ncbi:WhiB family transcriptional regulator [Nocardia gipuzkoensis]|uniref:WhiB family transcriptional regulator n=1 Tax=Nocardia gipuzkoensis TaxID=2749991 RepID=UPI001E2A58C0|nr:WhiB family transcriptional regulator [Nocardia gipuzkoensis]UGT71874.1 WhiB family transcriptional regulator [Nocardia gipuzkoensis]